MNMPLVKAEPATVTPAATAKVLALPPKRRALATRTATVLGKVAERVVPPVVVIAVALLIWELLCRRTGSTLPPPSRVLSDTWELIIDPFFDRGGLDKGLFWHLSASLQRVAFGYVLASFVGVALGTLVGQSTWAMRGLDPIFQVLRTVPPLAWLPLSLAARFHATLVITVNAPPFCAADVVSIRLNPAGSSVVAAGAICDTNVSPVTESPLPPIPRTARLPQ